MNKPQLSVRRTAERDLRRMGPGPERKRVRASMERLGSDEESLNITALRSAPGWLRLRVGDYRVLYFVLTEDDRQTYMIDRIVHRSELEAAVADLPAIEGP